MRPSIRRTLLISIHPPRAGRDCKGDFIGWPSYISIHPPRAGRDLTKSRISRAKAISIHPPRAGRDVTGLIAALYKRISIHPPRAGRDGQRVERQLHPVYFNPPAPCGAGPSVRKSNIVRKNYFNPPAPCGAGRCITTTGRKSGKFQSTRPVRGGTSQLFDPAQLTDFNPPAPCGAGQNSPPACPTL